MRSLLRFLGVLLSIGAAFPAAAQGPRPQFRPALLKAGPDSLINRIDVKDLLSKGQKDGAVQFRVSVGADGRATEVWAYREVAGSEALKKEVLKRLEEAKFTGAIYEHQPSAVLLSGTVIFNVNGKPHLHIFLNQDPQELKEGSDFIAPQPVFGADSGFTGLHSPGGVPVVLDGVVGLEVQVDAKGNLHELKVTGEDPPLLGFADAAASDFREAKFIPAFRSGDATESKCLMSVCYKPVATIAAPVQER